MKRPGFRCRPVKRYVKAGRSWKVTAILTTRENGTPMPVPSTHSRLHRQVVRPSAGALRVMLASGAERRPIRAVTVVANGTACTLGRMVGSCDAGS